MASLTKDQKHKILRNIYRNYTTYQDHFMRTGQEFIEHKGLTISFTDLKYGVQNLAPRKKEAFFYNVLFDMTQEETAKKMGITTVTVGQYVDSAMKELSKRYFADDEDTSIS